MESTDEGNREERTLTGRNKMRKIFQIGAFCFELCYTDEIRIPPNFLLFECADGIPQYEYRIKTGKELPVPEGKQIAKRPDIAIFQSKDLESRLVGIKGDPDYYACYEEVDHNHARVTIRTDKLKGLHIDPVFSSLLALERRMLQRDSLIFHCAYLQYQ